VFAGSEDGNVYVWNTVTGEEVAVWRGHAGVVGAVQWNPRYVSIVGSVLVLGLSALTCCTTARRYMMAASADFRLVFWIPGEKDKD
jgi:WD40 repeat protein